MMRAMRPDDLSRDLSIETLAVHAGQEPDPQYGAVAPPIYQTSTYRQPAVGQPIDDYDYARSKNPTRDRFERAGQRAGEIPDLEFGHDAPPFTGVIGSPSIRLKSKQRKDFGRAKRYGRGAPQCCSSASRTSAATPSASRPSMWCRGTNATV